MLKFKGNHLQREVRQKEGKKEKEKTVGIFPTSRDPVKKIKIKLMQKRTRRKEQRKKKKKTCGGGGGGGKHEIM